MVGAGFFVGGFGVDGYPRLHGDWYEETFAASQRILREREEAESLGRPAPALQENVAGSRGPAEILVRGTATTVAKRLALRASP